MILEEIAAHFGVKLFDVCKVAGTALAEIIDKGVDKVFELKDEDSNCF